MKAKVKPCKITKSLILTTFLALIITLNVFPQIDPNDPGYDEWKRNIGANMSPGLITTNSDPIPFEPTSIASTTGLLIPLDGTFTQAMARNDDSYTSQISFPFNYQLYGNTYTSCFINNNGNISFLNPYYNYTPYGFPVNGFAMIAAFWADVDTRNTASGLVWYKIEPHRFTVIWDQVGYYPSMADKVNTFELIFTDGTDPLIGLGNNVAFSYGDMQWTTGSASGGSGGYGGTPATVGINKGDGIYFALIGRFDHPGFDYDGPGGNNDGISYMDDKVFTFKVSSGDFTNYNYGGIYLKILETANTNQVKFVGYKYQYKMLYTNLTIIKNSDYFLVENGQAFLTEPTFPFLSKISSDFLDQIILYNNEHEKIGHINFDYEFRWEGTHTRHAILFLHNDPAICGSNHEYFPYNQNSPNNPPNKTYNYYDIGEYPVSMLIPPHFLSENDNPDGYRFPENYNLKPILFVHGLTGTFSYQDEAKPYKTEIIGDQVSYWFNTERKVNQKMTNGNRKYHAWQFYYPNEDDLRHCGLMLGKSVEKLYGLYQQPINIVAHSMGGLVTMDFLIKNSLSYNNQTIGKVLLSTSPIHGSLAANRVYLTSEWGLQGIAAIAGFDRHAPCYRDLSIGSDFLYNLHQCDWNAKIDLNKVFVLMGETPQNYILPKLIHVEAEDHEDGIASFSSVSLLDKGIGFAGFYSNHDDGKYGKNMDANFLPDIIDAYFTNDFLMFKSYCQTNTAINVYVDENGDVIKPLNMSLSNLSISKNDVNFHKGLVTLILNNSSDQILSFYKRETIFGTYIKDYVLSPNQSYTFNGNYFYTKLGRFHKNIFNQEGQRYFFTKDINTRTDGGFEFDNFPGPMNLIKSDVFGWPTVLSSIPSLFVQHQFHYTELAKVPLLLVNQTTPTKLLKSAINNNNLTANLFIDNQTSQAKFYLYSEAAALRGISYNIKLISPDGSEIDSTSINTVYSHDSETSVKTLTVLNIEPGVWQMIPIFGTLQLDNLGMITKGELVSDLRTESLIRQTGNSMGSSILIEGIIKMPDIALFNLDSLRVYAKINREMYSYDSIILDNFQVVDTAIVFSNSFLLDSTGIYNYIITIDGVYDNYKFERALYGDFSADNNNPQFFIPDQEMNIANSFIELKLPNYLFCQNCNSEEIVFNTYLINSTFGEDTIAFEYFEDIHSLYIDVNQGSPSGEANFEVECIISDTMILTNTFKVRYTPPGIPKNLNISSITCNSVDLQWISTDIETQWDIIYGPHGFNNQIEGILLSGITQNPFTIYGLDSQTSYDFYVRAVFEESASSWSWPVSSELTVNEPIAVVVSKSLLPEFCQGQGVLLTAEASLSPAVSYLWSTGDTTQTILAGVSDVYTVTVTNVSGCTANASYDLSVDITDLLSSYVIFANKHIRMDGNTVNDGGIGVRNIWAGCVEARYNTNVTDDGTFAKAKLISTDATSVISNKYFTPLTLPWPVFEAMTGNPYIIKNIPANTTMTLDGNLYKEVKVGVNAIAIFTQPVIDIKIIRMEDGATLKFTQSAKVHLKEGLISKKNVTINPDELFVVFYIDCDVQFLEGANVTGVLYLGNSQPNSICNHKLSIAASKTSRPAVFKGMFLAESIYSMRNTNWYMSSACNINTPVEGKNFVYEPSTSATETGILLKSYPNPFSEKTNIVFRIPIDTYVKLDVFDISGKLIKSLFNENAIGGQDYTIEFESNNLTGGVFLIKMSTNNEVITGKLIQIK